MAGMVAVDVDLMEEKKKRPFFVDVVIRIVKEKPLCTIGGVIVLLLFLVGILADILAPHGYNEIELSARLTPPSRDYLLGGDALGRDLLSRIIYGARISMYVGLGAASISVVLATLIGGISGFFGGKTDMLMQRLVDSWMCFPPLFLILTIMAVLGPGVIQVIMVLGILNGISRSRIVRGAVISIKENMYVQAVRAIGASNSRIFLRHIFPNVLAPIIIIFTIEMGAAIISEASISFLGFGIPPPIPSWGGMLSDSGRRYMLQAPWMALWPGIALAIVVYGINMLGDALRDILDPRLRGGLGRYGRVKVK